MIPFDTLTHRGQVARMKRLAERALHAYDVGQARLTPLAHLYNTTFRVDTPAGERYVLRIHTTYSTALYPAHSLEVVRSELAWLAALQRDTDLVVPDPVPTRDGALLTVVEVEGVPEPRICVLFRWVEGRFLSKGLAPTHLERVGEFMARLHNHSEQFALPDGFKRGEVDTLHDSSVAHILDTFAEVRPLRDMQVVAEALGRVRETLAELSKGPDVYGLIHADLHYENFLFHNGQVRAIDFDDCGWGHRLFDLGVTLSQVEHKKGYSAMRAALLRGYRSIRPLSPQHEAFLDTFIALRHLQLTTWFISERHRPEFRNEWEEESDYGVEKLKAFLQSL